MNAAQRVAATKAILALGLPDRDAAKLLAALGSENPETLKKRAQRARKRGDKTGDQTGDRNPASGPLDEGSLARTRSVPSEEDQEREREGTGDVVSSRGTAASSPELVGVSPKDPKRPGRKTPPPDVDEDPRAIRSWLAMWGIPPLDDPQDGPEVSRFLDRNRAKGESYIRWDAAWRTWRDRAAQWSSERRAGARPVAALDPDEQDADGHTAEERERFARRRREQPPPPSEVPPEILARMDALLDVPTQLSECIDIAKISGRTPEAVRDDMERARLDGLAKRDAAAMKTGADS